MLFISTLSKLYLSGIEIGVPLLHLITGIDSKLYLSGIEILDRL